MNYLKLIHTHSLLDIKSMITIYMFERLSYMTTIHASCMGIQILFTVILGIYLPYIQTRKWDSCMGIQILLTVTLGIYLPYIQTRRKWDWKWFTL